LRRKILQQRNLLVGEGTNFLPNGDNLPEECVVLAQRIKSIVRLPYSTPNRTSDGCSTFVRSGMWTNGAPSSTGHIGW